MKANSEIIEPSWRLTELNLFVGVAPNLWLEVEVVIVVVFVAAMNANFRNFHNLFMSEMKTRTSKSQFESRIACTDTD